MPLRVDRFEDDKQVEHLRQDFRRTHGEIFVVCDPDSPVGFLAWQPVASPPRPLMQRRLGEEATATLAGEIAVAVFDPSAGQAGRVHGVLQWGTPPGQHDPLAQLVA